MAVAYSNIPAAHTTVRSDFYTNQEATFDAYLYKPQTPPEQLKLLIQLRVNLRQWPLGPIPLVADTDGKPFWAQPWPEHDWRHFVRGAAWQASLWNDKFWLVPPETCKDYDVATPHQVWRPNIRCELAVDFAATRDVHKTIKAANIDLRANVNPRDFRAAGLIWCSLSAVPFLFPASAGAGPFLHSVIAHELGHLIGLGHIGLMLKTPLCMSSIAIQGESEGRNDTWCYGVGQGKIQGNIMGTGSEFTEVNAIPWVWAIKQITGRSWEHWKVVTKDPGPAYWVRDRH